MTLRERTSLVGVSLRSMLNHTLLSKEDREMREVIAALHQRARIERAESIAGRDLALDMLAGDR